MLNRKLQSMVLDGCLEDKKTYAKGTYRGFSVILDIGRRNNRNVWQVTLAACREDAAYEDALRMVLANLTRGSKEVFLAERVKNRIILHIKQGGSAARTAERINRAVQTVTDFLALHFYTTGCMDCGSGTETPNLYHINGERVLLCSSCAEAIRENLESLREEAKHQKSKLLPGLVGAVLGALAGGVLWVLIYKLGYIAGLAGLLIAILSLKGYEKFGGYLDVKGVIASVIVIVAAILMANRMAWAWEAYDALKDYDWTFFDCYRELIYILKSSEIYNVYLRDLLMGLGLTAVCSAGSVISAIRNGRGFYVMKKEK